MQNRRSVASTATAAILMSLFGTSAGLAGEPPLTLAVLTDMSSNFSDISGPGSVTAARLAIEDSGNTAFGQPIRLLYADHQNKPDVGSTIARQWFDRDVDVILDVPNSAVALSVAEIAEQKKRFVMFSSAQTDRLTEENCTPYTVQWTQNSSAAAYSAVLQQKARGHTTWFVITYDYAVGKSLDASIRAAVGRQGGKVLGTTFVPLGTADFAAYLLQAQGSGAQVIAVAVGGSDIVTLMKQMREFRAIANEQSIAYLVPSEIDVMAGGIEAFAGAEGAVSFTWNRTEASRAFSRRFTERMKAPPSMLQAGVYSAALQYIAAVKATGSRDPLKISSFLQKNVLNDMFLQNAKLLPNGLMTHDMYTVQVKTKEESTEPWDFFEITGTIGGKEAFSSTDVSKCPSPKRMPATTQ